MDTTTRPVVFVARGAPSSGMARLKEACEVIEWEGQDIIPQDTFIERVRQCKPHGLFIFPPEHEVTSKLLDAAGPQLKVIGTMSVGLDHIDLEECRRRGVAVGHTPGVLTNAVAEHTIGLLLTTARNYKPGTEAVSNGVWGTRWDNALWMAGKEVGGSVLGIVGLGRIGLAVAKRLKAFSPSRILYCNREPKDGAAELGAELVTFNSLLNQSDFVIATCSVSEKNKGLFNKEAFIKMKNTAVFINVSRGVLVNQDDLYDALVAGHIAGVGLDVTSPEPLPPHHRLLKLDNCVVTPHIGCVTIKTRNIMCNVTVDNILAGIRGKSLPSSAF